MNKTRTRVQKKRGCPISQALLFPTQHGHPPALSICQVKLNILETNSKGERFFMRNGEFSEQTLCSYLSGTKSTIYSHVRLNINEFAQLS